MRACASVPTRISIPPRPLTVQHMMLFTMEHRAPIIFFSATKR
jgi:hypothetical protein